MLIVANFKSFLLPQQELELLQQIATQLPSAQHQLIICPTFISLMQAVATYPQIQIGAQNCSAHELGAYTGDITAAALKSIGVQFVMIGHHEIGDDTSTMCTKIERAHQAGIRPIICVGESDPDDTHTFESTVARIATYVTTSTIIAYEPGWAIGVAQTAPADLVATRVTLIKQYCPQTPVLYGGSVTESSITQLIQQATIDGVLLGRASTNIQQLQKIVSLGCL